METEHWALVISIISLFTAIGIPLWQWRESTAPAVAEKRTLLLQTILSARSISYASIHELNWLLTKYKLQMRSEERKTLEDLVVRLRESHDDLEKLHTELSDHSDGATLIDIEQTQASANFLYSEARDIGKTIENGRRSYEDMGKAVE